LATDIFRCTVNVFVSIFKLENYSFHVLKFENVFCPHIVNVWNSLPDCVVDMDNLDKFKTCIDEIWQHQKVLFNYKSELWNRKPITDPDLEIWT